MVRARCLALAFGLFLSLGSHAAPTDVPSAASFYVPSIPDIHQDPNNPLTIFAGHIQADPDAAKASAKDVTSHLYFVLVKNRRVADKQRVMFWFNGGPGCSSFDGLMMEVGPWRMDGKGGFKVEEGGWEEYMTVVYVDQPVGTGFSYGSSDKYVHTMEEAVAQFMEFLGNFYKVFPEYQHMDTYLGGESYAGQWIPYFADGILSSKLGVGLRGIAIGNGWIDARRQYPSYLDYAVKVGILEENTEPWKRAKARTDECMADLNKITDPKEPIVASGCEGLLLDVTAVRERIVDGRQMCINIYDVRLDDVMPACGMNWPAPIHPVTNYLGRADVVRALHADRHPGSWVECRGRIHQEFRERKVTSSITVLPKVLSQIPVLLFAGDQDLICNYVGMEAIIAAMEWNGAKGLGTVQTQSWSVADVPAGTWVSSRNLTYAKIFNASHMAPYDLPHVTHDMILRFIGVNFTTLVGGTAKIPSSLGTVTKPMFVQDAPATTSTTPADAGKSPQQAKAMWEAYYNAGSAALVLTVIFAAIGIFVWCRMRRARSPRLPVDQRDRDRDESIPLNSRQDLEDDDETRGSRGKGKERATGPPIFDVGDDEEDYKDE